MPFSEARRRITSRNQESVRSATSETYQLHIVHPQTRSGVFCVEPCDLRRVVETRSLGTGPARVLHGGVKVWNRVLHEPAAGPLGPASGVLLRTQPSTRDRRHLLHHRAGGILLVGQPRSRRLVVWCFLGNKTISSTPSRTLLSSRAVED